MRWLCKRRLGLEEEKTLFHESYKTIYPKRYSIDGKLFLKDDDMMIFYLPQSMYNDIM